MMIKGTRDNGFNYTESIFTGHFLGLRNRASTDEDTETGGKGS